MSATRLISLQAHPFFEKIDSARLKPLLEAAEVLSFQDKSTVFDEGSPADALFLILSGRVAFRKLLPSGDYLTVSFSGVGEHFGEVGVLTREPRSLRAETQGEAVIARISGNALVEYMKTLPGPVDALLQSLIRHLHETTRQYVGDMLHKEKMAVVGSMVNTIIHDFKNPFCLISLSAQILRQKVPDPETAQLCNNIEDQVERMVDMARELAEFSRGETSLNKTRLNLRDLITDFQRLNFPYFDNDRITLSVNVPHVEFFGERAKMLRVIQNLVGNAVDAFGDEPGTIEISAELLQDEHALELRIKDNGKGIPETIRDRFFDPFVTYGKKEGTGLGSAIAKSIIESHDGSIRFQTETDVGTIFIIRLPRA